MHKTKKLCAWLLAAVVGFSLAACGSNSENTDVAEVKAGTVYIKELSAPAGYKVDKTVYPLTIKAGETATLKVSDTPKVTDTLIELFKIDMETQKDNLISARERFFSRCGIYMEVLCRLLQ